MCVILYRTGGILVGSNFGIEFGWKEELWIGEEGK
jgi:hypothetical protein